MTTFLFQVSPSHSVQNTSTPCLGTDEWEFLNNRRLEVVLRDMLFRINKILACSMPKTHTRVKLSPCTFTADCLVLYWSYVCTSQFKGRHCSFHFPYSSIPSSNLAHKSTLPLHLWSPFLVNHFMHISIFEASQILNSYPTNLTLFFLLQTPVSYTNRSLDSPTLSSQSWIGCYLGNKHATHFLNHIFFLYFNFILHLTILWNHKEKRRSTRTPPQQFQQLGLMTNQAKLFRIKGNLICHSNYLQSHTHKYKQLNGPKAYTKSLYWTRKNHLLGKY